MFFFLKIKNKIDELSKRKWSKGILVRTALLSWILIIATLLIFILGTLPYQNKVLEERMRSEANDIANSIGQVTATAVINNDYGFIVDYCMRIIKQSNSILYVVITRNDGFSLIHTADNWKQETITNELDLPKTNDATDEIVHSKLVQQEVFHYSFPFTYSGIDWGRINVGLSLEKYNQNIKDLYYRTIWLAVLSIIIGLIVSVYFAKKLTDPIRQLDSVAHRISKGNLNVRVDLNSEDEIGRLSHTFNKMADNLKNSQDNLERKVEERTFELADINKKLQTEIKERLLVEKTLKQNNSRLEVFDKIYRGIISAKSVEEIINETLIQLPILFDLISTAAVAMPNIDTKTIDVRGVKINDKKQNSFINYCLPLDEIKEDYKNTQIKKVHMINDIRMLGNKNPMEKVIYKHGYLSYISVPLVMDEERIGNLVITSEKPDVFIDDDIEILLYFSNQLAVAISQAQLQAEINIHAKSLQNSLSEKEVLLKEIHHRVKNNLQVISSLLYLNSRKIKDEEALNMFKDSQNRVKSIALVHERLYQSKDLGKIDFKEYVTKLTNDLFRSYAVNTSLISLNININDIFISIDTAVPCGLIINELVSNSLKYAFPDIEKGKRSGEININFNRNKKGELILKIFDNGIGISGEIEEKKKNSLGLQLVENLVAQLEGDLEIDHTSGTLFIIVFKEIKT